MFGTVTLLTLAVVVYLALMANVMRLNYVLVERQSMLAKIAGESSRLDDSIARLSARDRLAAIAAKLGMQQPQTFAAVVLPQVHPVERRGLAFLDWVR